MTEKEMIEYLCSIPLPAQGLDLAKAIKSLERDLIHKALISSCGVVNQAAKLLSLRRGTLLAKIYVLEMTEILAQIRAQAH